MGYRHKKNTRHYTASDTADYYRYLKDAVYLTTKAYREWLEHPNHELIAKFEADNIPIPEELQKLLDNFRKRGEQLRADMVTAKNYLEVNVKRLGRSKVRKAAETYRRPH